MATADTVRSPPATAHNYENETCLSAQRLKLLKETIMVQSRLIVGVLFANACLATGAVAQTTPALSAAQQLQWDAVEVTAGQFKGLRELAIKGLGMRLLLDQPNFAVLAASNGSLLEIYGPGSRDYPWRHGQGGISVGFLTDDIAAALKNIQSAGGVLVGDLEIVPKAGVNGGDYAFQLFKAPDNRIYAIAQSKGYHATKSGSSDKNN